MGISKLNLFEVNTIINNFNLVKNHFHKLKNLIFNQKTLYHLDRFK